MLFALKNASTVQRKNELFIYFCCVLGMGMTTILTLTAMFSSVRQEIYNTVFKWSLAKIYNWQLIFLELY